MHFVFPDVEQFLHTNFLYELVFKNHVVMVQIYIQHSPLKCITYCILQVQNFSHYSWIKQDCNIKCTKVSKAFCSTVSINMSATTTDTGDPIAVSCTCWQCCFMKDTNVAFKYKKRTLKMLSIVSPVLSFIDSSCSNLILSVNTAKSVGTLVKRLTTSKDASTSSGRMVCLLMNSTKLQICSARCLDCINSKRTLFIYLRKAGVASLLKHLQAFAFVNISNNCFL